MTKEQAVREFKEQYVCLYVSKVDYWYAQQVWSLFTDSLCKEGRISEKQYSKWTTPFPYGKKLSPSKRQLEIRLEQLEGMVYGEDENLL